MSIAAPVVTQLEWPVPVDANEGLRALAPLLRERSASCGFVSLLLAGSLARDEGSLLLTSAGPQLFNDVDLVLVTERPAPSSAGSAWAEEATRLLAPDSAYAGDRLSPLGLHVDLAVLPRSRLGRLPCTLFNFDLQSARVLGGTDVLREIPLFRPSDIPAREALLLLGNRCLSLCESADPPEAGTAIWMYYHALKALLDSAAALLILSGHYRTRQQERLVFLEGVVRAEFPSLLGRWPHFVEVVEAAGVERRRLRRDIGWGEAVVRWREARGVILLVWRCCLARVLGLPEHSPWAALSGSMHRWWTSLAALGDRRHPLAAAARWTALRTAGRPRRLLAQAAIYAAVPHLLTAIEPGGETPDEFQADLALAGSYLSQVATRPTGDGRERDWRNVRDAAVDCWKRAA